MRQERAGQAGDRGAAIYALAARIYPICRSLAGPGVRQTLEIIDGEIGLTRTEVLTGAPANDWTVPREWLVREAWIRDPQGRTVLDFAECNLHVMNYSVGVRRRLPLAELREHVFSLPGQPDAIPYRTSYYSENWGFCMRHRDVERLAEGEYEVCIDAEPLNLSPKGEPQLGRRGLHGSVGGTAAGGETMALLWVLNLADGWHSLLDIAERSGLGFARVEVAAERLRAAGLLADASAGRAGGAVSP